MVFTHFAQIFTLVLAITLLQDSVSASTLPCSRIQSENYELKIFKNAHPVKEYLVRLECRGPDFQITSDVQEDSKMALGNSTKNIYSVSFTGGKLSWQNFEATLSDDPENFFFQGKGNVDIRLQPLTALTTPTEFSSSWLMPFLPLRSGGIGASKSKIAGRFGDFRKGHEMSRLHTGIDILGDWGEEVYPAAPGRVEYVSYDDPEGSIILRHILPNKTTVYSHYAHVKSPSVKVGQLVSQNTRLARIFNEGEFKESKFPYNHLHFEVRKSYLDKGKASTNATSRKYLGQYFYDPEIFLKSHAK